MSTCLLLISDGREEYLQQTLASIEQHLPTFDQIIHIDDTHHELGFAGAIQAGWDRVDTDHVFHVEADFTFNRTIPLDRMLEVLTAHQHLTQIALLRQPWNRQEQLAGGIWQQHPDSYTRHGSYPVQWMEHARFWTTNPCLYPRWITGRDWPQAPQSEGLFGLKLFAEDPARRAAFWGTGEEWVTHIGQERTGTGY